MNKNCCGQKENNRIKERKFFKNLKLTKLLSLKAVQLNNALTIMIWLIKNLTLYKTLSTCSQLLFLCY